MIKNNENENFGFFKWDCNTCIVEHINCNNICDVWNSKASLIENIIEAGKIEIKTPDDQYAAYQKENPRIHIGDAKVLALALKLGGIAILDDEEVRRMAEIEGIEHHGTISLVIG